MGSSFSLFLKRLVVIMIDKLLTALDKNNGSDLHLIVGLPPFIRVDGSLRKLETNEISSQVMEGLVKSITTDHHQVALSRMDSGRSVNFAFEFSEMRFRVNICVASGEKRVVIRRLTSKLLTCGEIGLQNEIVDLLSRDRGLILVTGATGSGKTTTLASMIVHISGHSAGHITTIEDPMEYRLPHGKGVTTQREVGVDLPDFQSGLVEALREDPDVILIGEMRNKETMQCALTAAETGHLVLATLHTFSAASTITRIVDAFPEGDQSSIRAQLASSVLGIISQKLIPRGDGGGVVAAIEFLAITPGVQSVIRSGDFHKVPSQIQTGAKYGMRLMDESIFNLWTRKVITDESALMSAKNPEDLAKRIVEVRKNSSNA